jgi:hypothetical protein
MGRFQHVPDRRAISRLLRYAEVRRNPPRWLNTAAGVRHCALEVADNRLAQFNFVPIVGTMGRCATTYFHRLPGKAISISMITPAVVVVYRMHRVRAAQDGLPKMVATSMSPMTGRTESRSLTSNSMSSRFNSGRCWTNCCAKHNNPKKGGVT